MEFGRLTGELGVARADFRIVTPMFLGDAQQEASRISAAGIKGALVFWWRALHFAGLVAKAGGNAAEALKSLQAREQALFGGPTGQSRVLFKIDAEDLAKPCQKGDVLRDAEKNTVGPGACYLGYGLVNAFHIRAKPDEGRPEIKKGELLRPCFPGGSFTLRLIFRPGTSEDQRKEVLRALKALGLLGGLGSRVRRGWGSLALTRLEGEDVGDGWQPPKDRDEYIEALQAVLGKRPEVSGPDFPLTALAKESQLRVGTQTGADPLTVLNELGEGLQRYRAWGFKEKVNGKPSEKNFADDHDWFKKTGKFAKGRGDFVPRRTAFGLPHNYSKHFGVTAPDQENLQRNRRASPLFFHIHHVGNEYLPVALFVPTQFLPTGKVAIWEKNRGRVSETPRDYEFDPSVITNFLDGRRPNGKKANPEYFPNEPVLE